MNFIYFSPSNCVRSLSTNSICNACSQSCPTEAIVMSNRLPSINHSLCVGCGGCGAVCPTEAITMDNFSGTQFFFSFLNDEDKLISCQKNIPCIAALSDEHIIGLNGLKNGIEIDIGHCSECSIGKEILEQMSLRLESIDYLLSAIESISFPKMVNRAYKNHQEDYKDRRDFFKTFHIRGMFKAKEDFEKEVQKNTDEFVQFTMSDLDAKILRTKKITDRRKLFYTSIKRLKAPDIFHVVDSSKISFTSQKLMDSSKCTSCEMCYRVCPTGALSSDLRNSKIDFDPFLCVKCHLCHDVCEVDAITLSSSYNLKEWFQPSPQNLITYSISRCHECDAFFSSTTGETVCRRCKLEEEEARELWGL